MNTLNIVCIIALANLTEILSLRKSTFGLPSCLRPSKRKMTGPKILITRTKRLVPYSYISYSLRRC